MEYINIEIEEKFLRCILFDKELLIRTMNKGSLPKEVFADKSFRLIFKIINGHFLKNGVLPTIAILRSAINRYSLKTKDSKLFQEKLFSVVDRLVKGKPAKKTIDNFDTYLNELIILMKARALQKLNMDLFDHLDNARLEDAERLVGQFQIPSYGEDIDSSEFTENFNEREFEVMKKVSNPNQYALYSTGIIKLDKLLKGGLDKEYVMVGGSSNAGKSFMLQHLARVGYMNRLNVILFTIEMRKVQVQNRIDCAIANIDYEFFRNPIQYYNKDLHDKWRKAIVRAKKQYGKLEVVAFKKNATMDSIESKIYEIMNKWQEPIHAVVIDYLDDIQPRQQYREARNWASFGEISWDMHQLNQYFRNFDGTSGLLVISASQFKKDSKEVSVKSGKVQRLLDERDTGSSPLPYRHSDVYLGIRTIDENIVSQIVIMKGRSTSKATWVDCYHNFPYGRFHDENKKKEYMENEITEDEKQALEEIQIDDEGE